MEAAEHADPSRVWVTVYADGLWAVGQQMAVADLDEVAKLATRSNWSPGCFEGGHRSTKDFLWEDVIGLDVDGGMDLGRAAQVLEEHGLAGALLPTKSHQKEKDGAPPCDRFRVILPLSERITDPRDHLATWSAARDLFDAVVDPAAKDAARYFFKSRGIHRITQGRRFSVVRAPPPEPPKPRPEYRGDTPPEIRWDALINSLWGRMDRELSAGSGRHEAIHRVVQTLAGLHAGAGAGYPPKDNVSIQAVAELVARGRPTKTAEDEVARSWKAGLERPFWPEEKPPPPPPSIEGPKSPEPPPIQEEHGPARNDVGVASLGLVPVRLVHIPYDAFIAQPAADAERLTTYLYRGALSMFNGEPGGTKSWLLLHEALEAARKELRVLYVALEGQKRKIQERVRRLTLEDNPQQLRQFLHISYQPGIEDSEGGRCFKLTDAEWVHEVLAELARPEWRADVLLIDPLADAVDGDPDKEVDVRPAKEALKLMRFRLNLAIGLGHHTIKRAWADSSGKREQKPSKADARGSGSWVGTAEISVDVTPTAGQTTAYGEALVTALKAKDYPEVPQERISNVTDRPTKDGQTVVVTALHDPADFQGGATPTAARYRREAIQALTQAPGGRLTQAELLRALRLPGDEGGPLLRALSANLGPLTCVTGAEAKTLGFSSNAKVYGVKWSVSES